MKCINHIDMDAVAICQECGCGLCSDCSTTYSSQLCDKCAMKINNSQRNEFIKIILISIVAFIIAIYLGNQINDPTSSYDSMLSTKIFLIVLMGCIPWGWMTLSRITSSMFIGLPIIGWAFYIIIKLFLSALIGVFVTPYQIYRGIKGIINTTANMKQISNTTSLEESKNIDQDKFKQNNKKITKMLAFSLLGFIVGFLLQYQFRFLEYIVGSAAHMVVIIAFTFLPWGWATISESKNSLIYIGENSIINTIIKIILSLIIGVFTVPYQIIKYIKSRNQQNI